jgi:2-phospho-L-lactate guanylyltransferase
MTTSVVIEDDLYVVLTARGIALSKARLADALTLDQRVELNRWLLARTLRTVAQWLRDMNRCIVVTACSEVLGAARGAGARVLEQPARGHNDAAKAGAVQVARLGARRIAFLPADLPDLTPAALEAFVARARDADFVLAPDKDGPGTNAVIAPAVADLEFFFGPESLAKYVQWAEARGWRVCVHTAAELAFDLDTPQDYAAWSSRLEPWSSTSGRPPVPMV